MKPRYGVMYLLLGVIFTLSSCVKHDNIFQGKEPEHTSDLEIPEGFDWSTTQAVSFTITSPSVTVASFYWDESCTPETQIGVLPVVDGESTYQFDLPYSQKAIFIQYPSTDGTTKTIKSVINRTVTKAVESDKVIFTEPLVNVSNSSLHIPYTGKYGTLMFEDTWPDTEDYDFNDVVTNYKIFCQYDYISGNINVDVSLRIRALGGLFPYDFAMQIGTWTSGSFRKRIPASDMVGIINKNVPEGLDVQALETEHPAIIVTGLKSLRKSSFYNTVSKENDGVQVDFTVVIKGTADEQWQRISGFPDPKAFDYFLRHENGREIHMMGYAPTSLYKQYDADVADKGGDIYYQNKKGLVWGLKVPVEIGWPAEKKDIMTVYTRFADWVESGGSLIGSDGYSPLKWYNFHTIENYIAN